LGCHRFTTVSFSCNEPRIASIGSICTDFGPGFVRDSPNLVFYFVATVYHRSKRWQRPPFIFRRTTVFNLAKHRPFLKIETKREKTYSIYHRSQERPPFLGMMHSSLFLVPAEKVSSSVISPSVPRNGGFLFLQISEEQDPGTCHLGQNRDIQVNDCIL
jgi:hypothetical protein